MVAIIINVKRMEIINQVKIFNLFLGYRLTLKKLLILIYKEAVVIKVIDKHYLFSLCFQQ
jgi:hypothetical protein